MKLHRPLPVLKQPCFAWGCEALTEAKKAVKGAGSISVLGGETYGSKQEESKEIRLGEI